MWVITGPFDGEGAAPVELASLSELIPSTFELLFRPSRVEAAESWEIIFPRTEKPAFDRLEQESI